MGACTLRMKEFFLVHAFSFGVVLVRTSFLPLSDRSISLSHRVKNSPILSIQSPICHVPAAPLPTQSSTGDRHRLYHHDGRRLPGLGFLPTFDHSAPTQFFQLRRSSPGASTMDDSLQQQRREEQILSLFESIEDRELRRSAPGDPAAPDQFSAPCEPADSRPPEAAPAGPAAAPALAWNIAAAAGSAQAVAAAQLPGVVNVKRKRGRPPKNAALMNRQPCPAVPPASQLRKPVEEDEDVCFICFDGGTLVLCDRKGCPKAYHPSCIKRDESFFQSRAKWMCGWHLCSTCGKGAYYMCYTCTYSLCKNCTKDADYVCVRGTKGLCGTCMKTIMLIENVPQENQERVQVDFDDKTSWEYLFKVYWVILKEKLSLTINELTQAKNPWIEPSFAIPSGETSGNLSYSNGDRRYGSGNSNGFQSTRVLRGRKAKEQPKLIDNEVQNEQVSLVDERPSSSQDAKWASKELLEFVAHMKDGDTSVLSQFDVQALLLEYIRKNNLRDTHRKCQIVCDSRLLNLFGKTVVGHFEMLKLLDSHFLVKENPKIDGFIRGSIVGPGSSQVNNSVHSDTQQLLDSNKRRKTRKKVDERVPQVNPDDYAAADGHNISLIYLRRNMMEKLLDDPEKFHDKVVGSMVRIKVSGSDQKQDIHRLVRVVGTSNVAEPYKVGDKTAGSVLEIMNLEKKELMPIDEISNQEISEDECGQLRQSIKCGQIKWLTVGELQQKALKLQEVRVDEWLESESLRLNHLRDRASEKGHQKEYPFYLVCCNIW
ncbi:hypothetical protein CRG98_009581 [Punica granatum]|uniref:Uncharacterized protein n=1 Tax=Punica granatum TaxID=22663 RepID=A0A2I0KNC8_PUNGR|nr:hypothetical protein CRG98_009581 [Punica granatum]